MQEAGRRSNKDRSDTTRAALIAAGRKLFVSRGYAETGTPELVAEAGVTRGALYHHFADKRALFRAVVEVESAAVAREIESAARPGLAPLKALSRGGAAFLEAMREPGRTQLLLIDAAAVLGREELDAIDARHGGRTLREGLAAAIQAGALPKLPLAATAQLLGAAYDRAALAIAAGAEPGEWHKLIDAVVAGLAAPGAPSR
ncbi:DNA-binding transcriptional regulator, AcrR family [Bosea lupini]|jgi:AcrR family transcriptional regulator|uniref:DNA-binding transcriptional regulator, AcrR family n=1 Tax=Bosea lupini TaxID=1036779 RepID=A0A1H7H040_9HYPH|nr:TetR/AcrR family transcriptional regulator [Bosea lupini]SEK42300.1 DNA-binding transcriptional regulator, AcrR family [Bosea lupini]